MLDGSMSLDIKHGVHHDETRQGLALAQADGEDTSTTFRSRRTKLLADLKPASRGEQVHQPLSRVSYHSTRRETKRKRGRRKGTYGKGAPRFSHPRCDATTRAISSSRSSSSSDITPNQPSPSPTSPPASTSPKTPPAK